MRRCIPLLAAGFSCLSPLTALASPVPDFNREVRPILAAKCFECHGPDEEGRKAKLRLDRPGTSALEAGGEALHRISSHDPEEMMPPPKSNKSLTPEQIDLLARWIAAGAHYEEHWAFVKPVRPSLPTLGDETWVRNPIDHFVLAALRSRGLEPAPDADRFSLVRRVFLDLTGLPPSPEEADAFVKDPDPRAYETLVQRLLDSPRYGERWARPWLDLARYADTNGYEKDRPRSMWPYRDWVIRALNEDLSFDQFTIEQLAGDLLPDATPEQRVATGFHRNTMMNEEGGIDPLEYRFHAMVDRVLTTGTTWFGLTVGCAQCHTHKYDPITHTDYYRMFALLNNADEPEFSVWDEGLLQRRADAEDRLARMEEELLARADPGSIEDWIQQEKSSAVPWTVLVPDSWETTLPKLAVEADGAIFATGDFTKRDVYTLRFRVPAMGAVTSLRLEALPDERLPAQGPGRSYYEGRSGDFFLSEFRARNGGQPVLVSGASADFGKIAVGGGSGEATNVLDGDGSTGWSTATREGERHELVLNLAAPLMTPTDLEIELLFERHFVAALGKFRLAATAASRPARARPGEASDPLTASDERLRRDAVRYAAVFAEARKPLEEARRRLPEPPRALVLQERPSDHPRPTHRHHRGEYLQPREEVAPGVPEILDPSGENDTGDRLAFARWVVSDANPLVARVAVNRAWHHIFGRGLVSTVADFGTQGESPTHPELLDWLAVQFTEQGWSMKELHRFLVTSATYRQSAVPSARAREVDPDNRWLSRGPRQRMEGESIRDLALAAGGLLSSKMYGPSVFPPQDASVFAAAYGNPKYAASAGEDRFRRSLYTHVKRTAPFAAFTVFDGPTGENCTAERTRSNTPLQALTLLNDPMFVEAADAMAKRAVAASASPEDRAVALFRACLTRPPGADELAALIAFQRAQALRLGDENLAWMLTARAILNLDETITKG